MRNLFDKMPKNIFIFDFPFRSMRTHTHTRTHHPSTSVYLLWVVCFYVPKNSRKGHVLASITAAVWRRLGAIDLFSCFQILGFTRYFSRDFCWIVLRPNGAVLMVVVELTWNNVGIVPQCRQLESVSNRFRLHSNFTALAAHHCVFIPEYLQKHQGVFLNLMTEAISFLPVDLQRELEWNVENNSPGRNDLPHLDSRGGNYGVKPPRAHLEGMCVLARAVKFLFVRLQVSSVRLMLCCVWFDVQDESRIKATVMEVKPVDHKDYSKRLIMNIRKLAAQ